ncbi:MAG: hypothetical protein JOY99_09650 [Sphingomonadaceae bacterium]|nr:hypothetical protein [Sphingomonadaceae bacterium]
MSRTAGVAAGGFALALLIAWMVPPTTPADKTAQSWRATVHPHAPDPATVALAGTAPADSYVAPGTTPALAYSPTAVAPPIVVPQAGPARSVMPRAPAAAAAPAQTPPVYVPQRAVAQQPAVPQRATYASSWSRATQRAAEDQPQQAYADYYPSDEQRYRDGYSWAANRDVQDPRECRRWRGEPGEDGCLDYLRDQDDREDRGRWGEW